MKDIEYFGVAPKSLSGDRTSPEHINCETSSKRQLSSSRLLVATLFTVLFVSTAILLESHMHQLHKVIGTLTSQLECVIPVTRREWRTLNADQQEDFITAIRCLHENPSRLGLNTTRYDDFVYVHVLTYSQAHKVAPSLPWHRYFIHVFENALKNECEFQGSLPYWDWTLDSSAPEHSPIWSAPRGFGGHGDMDTWCLQYGAFWDFRPQYPVPHCLKRNFISGMYGFNYTADVIQSLQQDASTYHEFRARLESGPHKSVHNGIGGEMPTDGSPNDPIFWVHHGQIDRLWWQWQSEKPEIRFEEYFGPLEADTDGDEVLNATLDDIITVRGLDEDLTVRDIMRTDSKLLCYRY